MSGTAATTPISRQRCLRVNGEDIHLLDAGMSHHYVLPKWLIHHLVGRLGSRVLFGDDVIRRTVVRSLSPLVLRAALAPQRLPPVLRSDIKRALGAPSVHAAVMGCADHEHRHRLGEIGCPTPISWGVKDYMQRVGNAHRGVSCV